MARDRSSGDDPLDWAGIQRRRERRDILHSESVGELIDSLEDELGRSWSWSGILNVFRETWINSRHCESSNLPMPQMNVQY